MEIATHKGVRLDVCRMCVGVWFDTTEFVATEGGGLFGVAPAYTGTKDAAWNGAAEAGIELLVEGILGWFFDS